MESRIEFDIFANEGIMRFIKKKLGIKKDLVEPENDALVGRLLGQLVREQDKLEKDFEPEPFKVTKEGYSMAVTGDITHVAEVFKKMNNWLNSTKNISEAKRYASDIRKGADMLNSIYKANKNKFEDEDDLADLIISKGTEIGKGIKNPNFIPMDGKPANDWYEEGSRIKVPYSNKAPTSKEAFDALRVIYDNHTPYSELKKKWGNGLYAGVGWEEPFWLDDNDSVRTSDMSDYFYHQGDPEKINTAPMDILYSYQATLGAVLDYCARCFDLDVSKENFSETSQISNEGFFGDVFRAIFSGSKSEPDDTDKSFWVWLERIFVVSGNDFKLRPGYEFAPGTKMLSKTLSPYVKRDGKVVSNLPAEYLKDLGELSKVYKQYRPTLERNSTIIELYIDRVSKASNPEELERYLKALKNKEFVNIVQGFKEPNHSWLGGYPTEFTDKDLYSTSGFLNRYHVDQTENSDMVELTLTRDDIEHLVNAAALITNQMLAIEKDSKRITKSLPPKIEDKLRRWSDLGPISTTVVNGLGSKGDFNIHSQLLMDQLLGRYTELTEMIWAIIRVFIAKKS